MHKKIFYIFGIVLFMASYGYSQNATLKGTVTDENGAPVDYATVRLMQEDALILGAVTDEKGNYTLKPVPTGKFDLVVSFIGCGEYKMQGIEFRGSIVKIEDVQLNCGSSSEQIIGIEVIATRPLFEKDQTVSQEFVGAEDLENMVGKSVSTALSTMSGVVSSSGGMSVRGNRPGQTVYYVDGIRSSGSGGVPFASISGISLISGGIPAKYGDGSSFVEIETKGPARKFGGNVDLYGNIDGYNNGGIRFSLTGPIKSKKPKKERKEEDQVRAGYLIAGDLTYSTGSTIRGGTYRAPQSLIDDLIANPLRSALDEGAMYTNISFITKDDLEKGRRQQNAASYGGNVSAKFDVRTKSVDIVMSGSFGYSRGRGWSMANSLFNSMNNGVSESMSGRAMFRLTQRFKSDTGSIIQNAYYRIQADYTFSRGSSYSDRHKDNYFDYGHIGKFKHGVNNNYVIGSDSVDGKYYQNVHVLSNFAYPIEEFEASSKNPEMALYTQYCLDQLKKLGATNIYNETVQTYNGLLNGESASSAYGMFAAPGVAYNGYSKSVGDQIGVKASVSFDIKDHAIELGYEFNQTISKGFSLSPRGLWTLMRERANSHIAELDINNPYITTTTDANGNVVFTDTIKYNRLVTKGSQSTFDRNLREKLGAKEDEWIDIDNYDPSTYSLDMFDAEELFNGGNNYVSYYGYNHSGTTTTNRAITMSDMKNWFNEGDPNAKARDLSTIGAYKPIYMAAYIQDRFSIKNLFFNVGVRVDVFDINQPIVKDMFLYREAYTVSETKAMKDITFANDYKMPSSMGDDYVIYVADPTATELVVTAYRSGMTWYDPEGNIVTDPTKLAAAAGATSLTPYLKSLPGETDLTPVHYSAFQDFSPTFKNGGITISPRLSFSFAVSDKSVFYAHYNVITKRQNTQMSPVTYLFFEKNASGGSFFSNTNLKPEKSIDYELGFKQQIGKNMALNLAAYYSEKRDQMQAYRYTEAYPATYYSYANIDFGTTQGFVVGLEMRRVKMVNFSVNYTLQFAKGTGSSATSAVAMIAAGQPNLKTLTNLSFDQRHLINARINLSFGPGEGPKTVKTVKKTNQAKEIKWLENAGLSVQFKAGSGLPYTRSSTITSLTGQGTETVSGDLYGSRMPWQFDCDLKIYKGWNLYSKDKEGKKKYAGSLQVYLDIQNILNLKQISSVFPYTGNPTDDGFLTSTQYQEYINSQLNPQSYIDYYQIYLETGRLGTPRRFVLGVSFNF